MKLKKSPQTAQEKVDERREEVLSKGRKFKYPLQFSRHRIVVNTILIIIVVLTAITISMWLALYRFGMTDEFLFRITRVFPVPVAHVDNENVLFSDYLMLYRSSMTSIERQSGSQFDEESVAHLRAEYKRSALDDSEKFSYAIKLAKELGIEISNDEVEAEFTRHLNIGGVERSEESFIKIIEDNFGLNKSEYERMLYLSIAKAKVSEAIDENAKNIASEVERMLSENGNNYSAVATALGDKIIYQETGGLVDSKNIDGGRATEAAKLEPGGSSGKFVSMNGDGYYFVKLVEKNDSQVNFVSIRVPFTEFNSRFDKVKADGGISELITIEAPNAPTNTETPAPTE